MVSSTIVCVLLASSLALTGASKLAFPSAQLLSLRSNKQQGLQRCNGRFDLCNLRFDQVTLLGSHNAGSYGYGRLSKCFYGNHNINEIEQLGRGIRFLDIDVCLRNGVVRTCHGRGKIAKIKRPLEDALKDVSSWVLANPSEVIMMSFGDHDPADPDSKMVISSSIAASLEKFFREPGIAVNVADITRKHDGIQTWPKLGDMVSSGRRVVLAYEGDVDKPQNDLYASMPSKSRDFILNLATAFRYTYSDANKADYGTMLKDVKHYCDNGLKNQVPIHLDIFLKPFRPRLDANTSGKEIDFVSRNDAAHCECNECTAKQLNTALTRPRGSDDRSVLDKGFDQCAKIGVHVHAVKVDFEEYGQLSQAIWSLNDRNVHRFCPSCNLDLAIAVPFSQNSFSSTLQITFLGIAGLLSFL